MNTLKHIVLIGVELIGGSLVLDLKRLGLVDTVTGIDLDRDNLDRALERRVIDRAYTQIDALSMHEADLAVIATPVSTFPDICRAVRPYLNAHTVVTDVGSTKQSAVQAFRSVLPEHLSFLSL